jgi:hypothetical protein
MTKINYNVLLASHLGCPARYITIKLALESVMKNTVLPDKILVGFSYKSDLGYPNTQSWRDICGDRLSIVYTTGQLTQFGHYMKLSNFISDNDVIMFLDDDDLYHPKKIELTKEFFENHPKKEKVAHAFAQFGRIEEHAYINKPSHGFRKSPGKEYYTLAIKGKEMKSFFNGTHPDATENINDLLTGTKRGVVDCIFSHCVYPAEGMLIKDVLYYQRRLTFSQVFVKDYTYCEETILKTNRAIMR